MCLRLQCGCHRDELQIPTSEYRSKTFGFHTIHPLIPSNNVGGLSMDVLCFCFLEGISDGGPKRSFRFALRWWFVDAMEDRQLSTDAAELLQMSVHCYSLRHRFARGFCSRGRAVSQRQALQWTTPRFSAQFYTEGTCIGTAKATSLGNENGRYGHMW